MEISAEKHHQSCGKNTRNIAGIDHQVWCRVFRRFHPAKTAERVAADIGASARTVENWMSGVSTPSLIWFARILAVYGPSVLSCFLPETCIWLDAAVRAEQMAALEAESHRIEAERARLSLLLERGA